MNMTQVSQTNNILSYLALLSFFGVVGFTVGALENSTLQPAAQPAAAIVAATTDTNAFQDISLVGKAAYVYDLSTNETLYADNELAQLPLASITKVAVALLADTHLRPDGVITFSESSLLPEGDSGFEVGEQWLVRDLIDFTLMTSSNDGATALAEAIVRTQNKDIDVLLNELAQELGLSQTYFVNETGLDTSTTFGGAYGSARDIAILFAHAYTTAPDTLTATTIPEYTFYSLEGKSYEATNTNKGIGQMPGLVFGKTGFTDLAGGNLAVVIESEPGHPFVVVVLGSTLVDRFEDVATLVQATLQASAH